MNEIKKTATQNINNAHDYLIEFLDSFYEAQRGGIHDYIEMSLCNLVSAAIGNIDEYLKIGHTDVNANEILHIVTDSYQKVLDKMKRDLEKIKKIHLQ